ncbi:MAG TPA: GxxExxY protein [Opitutaceae bacterium]|nr:GxxExxY protein [Opitutaceae bacterium]
MNLTQSREAAKVFPMNTSPMDKSHQTENEISREIVDAAYHVHRKLGPGLLESVYETVLAYELAKRRLTVARQLPVPIIYEDLRFDEGFRADLMIGGKVIVELKSVEQIAPVHLKQLLTYLRLADKRLGLLVNFGAPIIKDGIRRLVNGLKE